MNAQRRQQLAQERRDRANVRREALRLRIRRRAFAILAGAALTSVVLFAIGSSWWYFPVPAIGTSLGWLWNARPRG